MKHEQQVVRKLWILILEKCEKTKTKQKLRTFKAIKAIFEANHISTKELRRYHRRLIVAKEYPAPIFP